MRSWIKGRMLHNLTITAAKLGLGCVTAEKIAADAVTLAKLPDGALTANAAGRAKMADGYVTVAQLADGALPATVPGRAKMADGYVTPVKIDHMTDVVFANEDFITPATGLPPMPWANNEHNDATADFIQAMGGVYRLLTAVTNEAEAAQLSHGDYVIIDPTKDPVFEWIARVSPEGATLSADERIVMGLSSAHANAEGDLDAVTNNVWFRIEGASLAILVEADDGTTDTDDQDSTIVIVKDAWTHFKIDMSDLADIKFYIDGVEQGGAAVSAPLLTAGLQPIFCIQRDAGTEVNHVDIDVVYGRATR